MPALVAAQHDPHLRAFYQHLLATGKLCKLTWKMQCDFVLPTRFPYGNYLLPDLISPVVTHDSKSD